MTTPNLQPNTHITSSLSADKQSLTIYVSGNFDAALRQQFREAYENNQQEVSEYIVDFSATEYIDSSGLGMLLILKDFANRLDASVCLSNINEQVRKIFQVVNFEKLFNIADRAS